MDSEILYAKGSHCDGDDIMSCFIVVFCFQVLLLLNGNTLPLALPHCFLVVQQSTVKYTIYSFFCCCQMVMFGNLHFEETKLLQANQPGAAIVN